MSSSKSESNRLYEAILRGDAGAATSVVQAALAARADPQELLAQAMIPAMAEVGRLFEAAEYYVPELMIAARAMKAALDLLRPLLAARGVEPVARVVIGTVKGDLHDIGKHLVASMLEGGGFDVIDLGIDVPPERFLAVAQDRQAQIIALSAMLTTTMLSMKAVIELLSSAGQRERYKVIVGGAPVTGQFAAAIGADGYSHNATGAVALARRLVAV